MEGFGSTCGFDIQYNLVTINAMVDFIPTE